MKTAQYFLLILFGLLALFLTGLPNLRRCPLPRHMRCDKRLDGKDIAIMALIAILYSGVAFTALGNSRSPESFAPMWENCTIIELEEEAVISGLFVFDGVGEGAYMLDSSRDGLSWSVLTEFQKSYIDVFKWNKRSFDPVSARYLRIYASGPVYMGELAVLDAQGNSLPFSSSVQAISDEQELVPGESNFLNSSVFDEIYHARTAWEHLNGVYPYEVSHPPLGKLILALGMLLFGTTPFGWRFMGVFFGILMLPLIYVFAKKIFGGRSVPAMCSFVLATDFMHFVQTRIATIDTYGVFFIMLMYLFMYLFISGSEEGLSRCGYGHLALSGLFFGLGVACKWTAVYAGAGLALLWLGFWLSRRDLGLRAFLKNALFCLAVFVLLPAVIYYLSYFPYGTAIGLKAPEMFFNGEYARIVLDNQQFMFTYHSDLVAEHPYSSRWYQWMLNIRPILYYLQYFEDGSRSSFGAFLNPVLCWGGLLCLPMLLFCTLFRRDRDAAFILVGYLAQLLPWVFISRLTFEYHYFPCSVFLVLALGYAFKLVRSSSRAWKIYLGGFAAVSLGLFALFYPALSGMIVDNAKATALLGWLPTWPF